MIERCMKKPDFFDVLQHKENDRKAIFDFTVNKAEFIKPANTNVLALYVETFYGPKKVNHNDYVVKDNEGLLTVHTPDEFDSKFVKVKRTENK
jgi:hypothetical protein